MLRSIPRLLRHAVVVAVLLAVSASVYQSWANGTPGASGWVQTQYGPLGPADRDMMEKVRLAGLWEAPTSQQAQQMATSEQVKEVGVKLANEHAQLDEIVRDAGNKLGVQLPAAPTAQQNAWMNEISKQTGSDYDRVYIQRVREAHAMVLPQIEAVRATTQNTVVRELAITSAEFVNRHHLYLEETGLVDYSALPAHGPGLFGGGTDVTDLIVPLLVFIAALLLAIALFWALRNKQAPKKTRATVPSAPKPQAPDMGMRIPNLPSSRAVAALPAGSSSSESSSGRRSATATIEQTGEIPVIDTEGRQLHDTGAQYAVVVDNYAPVSETGTFRVTSTAYAEPGGPAYPDQYGGQYGSDQYGGDHYGRDHYGSDQYGDRLGGRYENGQFANNQYGGGNYQDAYQDYGNNGYDSPGSYAGNGYGSNSDGGGFPEVTDRGAYPPETGRRRSGSTGSHRMPRAKARHAARR